MSKPRYWWYRNVCGVIGAYPYLMSAARDTTGQRVTAQLDAMPRGGGSSRPVEAAALRALSDRERSDLAAIRRAIDVARRWDDGDLVLAVVRMWHWDRVKNFELIADRLHIGRNTAKRKNSKFVYECAKQLGYIKKMG